jgi:fatty-acyl-CoA synthase
MTRAHLLDRHFGPDWPDTSTQAAVAAIEAVPLKDRLTALNTYDALRVGATHNPGAPAIRLLPNADPSDEPITLTHAQFFGGVTATANALHALGVRAGDAVSFMLPLVPQAFMTLYGAEAAGIANPINPFLEPYQLVEILRAARTRVLVALGPSPGSDIWEKVQKIQGELPELAAIVLVNSAGHATAQSAQAGSPRATGAPVPIFDFDDLVAAQPRDRLVSARQIGADEVAAYFPTGGTTGTPKLVRHTHLNQVTQAWVIGLMLHVNPGESVLFGLPLFHVGGALTQALAFLSCGGNLVVVSPAGWRNPAAGRNVWKLVQRWRPVNMVGVPTVLVAALTIPIDGADISSLKRAAGGGSAIPVAVARQYTEQMKLPMLEVYGMTETASVHTMSYMDRELRLGAVGQPVPYAHVRVVKVDADGRLLGDCAPNEIGVVAMAGPGVFSGYLSDTHNQGAFVEPGWVNSGDLGRLDDQGYLWITGRAKDLVIRGGHNIDPQPIEEILYTHPAVELAAMVGRPDGYAGELPVAYVQLKPGQHAEPADLIDYVRERTPERAAVPVAIYLIAPMPLTGVGKVFKPALRWDAAQRVATQLMSDVALGGGSLSVEAGAHPVHGSLISVSLRGVPAALRAEIERVARERLGPLTMRHELSWS